MANINIFTRGKYRREYQAQLAKLQGELSEYEALKSEINSLVSNLENYAKYVSSCYENIIQGIQSEAVFSDFEKINEYAENIKRYASTLEQEVGNVNTQIRSCEDNISYYQTQLAKL